MRDTYIVCYDICEAKRLRKTFETCKKYGDHMQYSVFECDLDGRERVRMERELSEIIHEDEDQVLFIRLGPAEQRGEREIFSLGRKHVDFDDPCYVV